MPTNLPSPLPALAKWLLAPVLALGLAATAGAQCALCSDGEPQGHLPAEIELLPGALSLVGAEP